MGVRHVLCHFIILSLLVTFLFSIMYYVVSDTTYPSKYCNPDLCEVGERHVACHPPGFSLVCIKPRLIKFSTNMKKMILDEHNKLRNKVATGSIPNLKSAVRMATLRWNNDLAYFSGLNSNECEIKYDECCNTKQYREVGQNIAETAVNYKRINSHVIYEVVPQIIKLWFSEIESATQDLMDEYKTEEGVNIQNFSNIIHERTVKLGCGMTTYYTPSKQLMALFVCDYSFRAYSGLPIYTSGTKCSECQKGCNPKFPGLCNKREPIHSDAY